MNFQAISKKISSLLLFGLYDIAMPPREMIHECAEKNLLSSLNVSGTDK